MFGLNLNITLVGIVYLKELRYLTKKDKITLIKKEFRAKVDDYKELLILQYFNTVKAGYSYNEISKIFGLQVEQVDNLIDYLIKKGLIDIKGYIKVTNKGITLLRHMNLNETEFGTTDELNIFTEGILGKNEIYIPNDFNSKFKKNVL